MTNLNRFRGKYLQVTDKPKKHKAKGNDLPRVCIGHGRISNHKGAI
jgi:hypothetical protein